MIKIIDNINRWIGAAVAWLTLLMVLGTLYNVVTRSLLQQYSMGLGEVVGIMNNMVFLLAAPLLLQLDQHVRVDVFYSRMSSQKKALVDLLGTIFMLLPFCGFILYYSWGYVLASWQQNEASRQTDGLPALYLVKTLILIFAVLLVLQGIAIILKKWHLLRSHNAETVEILHDEEGRL